MLNESSVSSLILQSVERIPMEDLDSSYFINDLGTPSTILEVSPDDDAHIISVLDAQG